MRPTSLKAGDVVVVTRGLQHELTFVRREKNFPRPAVNVLQSDRYRGLYGPNDKGEVTMTDSYLSRYCARKSLTTA